MTHHSNNIQNWMHPNRLYEDNLFYYTLIIVFWFFVGFSLLGFELDGYSLKQNLFFNFLFYLFICFCMALCPFWFKLFFAKTHTAKREQEINHHLDELDQNERVEIETYLAQTGQLAMRPMQKWALVFLGSYFLFEVFFISAWVKDLQLIWQPKIIIYIIDFGITNTGIPPFNINRSLFMINIKHMPDYIQNFYVTEFDLLNSMHGHTLILFRMIKVFLLPFVLASLFILLLKPLKQLDFNRINPNYNHNLWDFIWSISLSLIIMVMFAGSYLFLVMIIGDDFVNSLAQGKFQWLNTIPYYIFTYSICLLFFKSIIYWIIFWKKIISKLFSFILFKEQA